MANEKVLIIGGGAREDALAWKLSQSQKIGSIMIAPGNGGTERHQKSKRENIDLRDVGQIIKTAQRFKPDLVIIGPEEPLLLGAANELRRENFLVFGHDFQSAVLEGSKSIAVNFMDRHNIPHPATAVFSDLNRAEKFLFMPPWVEEGKIGSVIKVDGLAAGKGVYVCGSYEESINALREIKEEKKFGNAGKKVVIQEKLTGFEVSATVIVAGGDYLILPYAEDHKQINDNDEGSNTGGMGALAPHPLITDVLARQIEEEIIKPTVEGTLKEERPLRGILFPGIMVTKDGPKVLEYNMRFGDPETESILPLLSDEIDFYEILKKTAVGNLSVTGNYPVRRGFSLAVAITAEGYPKDYKKGQIIHGLEKIDKEVIVFHAGTIHRDDDQFETAGGRVLMVAGRGNTIKEARKNVYESIGANGLFFSGMHYRKDIGDRKR